MFKFKSKFILATMVVFGVLASITGCNKDELPESTETNSESTEANFESIVDAYTTFANQAIDQYAKGVLDVLELSLSEWMAITWADTKGAVDGAINADDTSLPSPWNRMEGGLAAGAAASYKKYCEIKGITPGSSPPPPPPPPPPAGSPFSNPNNTFDTTGICHNIALSELINAGTPNDLVVMYNTMAADIQNITFNNVTTNEYYLTLPIGVYTSLYTLNNPYPFPTYEESELYMYLINFTDPVEAGILANYVYNMFQIGDVQACTSYSIAMEDFITASTMNPDNKSIILIGMAVFRNSLNFWN
jgi:hypothetical protein